MNFVARLKKDLIGDDRARFVFVNNFEVERSWAVGEPKLPGAGISFAGATVNRMEEMGALLAGERRRGRAQGGHGRRVRRLPRAASAPPPARR